MYIFTINCKSPFEREAGVILTLNWLGLFVCGISSTSGQLINELFSDWLGLALGLQGFLDTNMLVAKHRMQQEDVA